MKSVILLNIEISIINGLHAYFREEEKYVFEETIHHKDGGTSRFNPVTSGQISKYEGSDEDNMPLNQLRVGV